MPSPAEVGLLVTLFNAGRHAEVDSLSQQLLKQYPAFGFIWKVRGASLQSLGKEEALPAMRMAAELMPQDAEAHFNLANTLKDLGDLAAAESSYRIAVQIKPEYVEALNNLGVVLQRQGRLTDAVSYYQKATQIAPSFAMAHYNLGNALKDMRQNDNAVTSYRRALALEPAYAEALSNMGVALHNLGQLDNAVSSYLNALQINPSDAESHNNLGVALQELGRLDEAEASYRRALTVDPGYADAHSNLGAVLRESGRLDEAIAYCQRALLLNAAHAQAAANLGNALQDIGQPDEALAYFHRSAELQPDDADAHFNLGVALQAIGQFENAVSSYRRALAINPEHIGAQGNLSDTLLHLGQLDHAESGYHRLLSIKSDSAEAYNNLGSALLDLLRIDDAVDSFRQALKIRADYVSAQGNLMFALNYHPDISGEELFAAYRAYDERFGLPLRSTWPAHLNVRDARRRLKVGYVSPDFRMHSCRHFLEPLLAHHDKRAVEVYAYAELAREDQVTSRYKEYADHWVTTRGMSDEALAERIRADGIDILVDLAGHTAQNRLGVFARKPAPVSLSWLGFGYTTGLSAIDYFLSDASCVPQGSEHLFSETPWKLPTPSFAYRPAEGMGEVSPLPAVERGHVTFGTLTRAVRINHRTIRVWSDILKAVPNSRLVIDNRNFKEPAMQDRLAERFAEHGIQRERLEIGYHSPPWDVLRGMDIGLDCFPHNSGTTLFETLYMGVPYVTLADRPSVGRLGSSILEALGHPEWIARDEDEYVATAVALASDISGLSSLRTGLRTKMASSPLMDEPAFARKVEEAYQHMWQDWCQRGD